MKKLIIGFTGADGLCLGVRLLQHLRNMPNIETHLVMTKQAERNIELELERKPETIRNLCNFYYPSNFMEAPIASGSYVTNGMIIIPCSMKSLAAIVSGYTDNLLLRAADVCLKEKRILVLLPREMPLGRIHLRNLCAAADLGCVIVPPMLTFYNKPRSIQDQIDNILARILLSFDIILPDFRPWTGKLS